GGRLRPLHRRQGSPDADVQGEEARGRAPLPGGDRAGMSTVAPFTHFNLANVPEALRLLAHQIEASPGRATRVMALLEAEDGETTYRAFGSDPFTRGHAVGMCFGIATQISSGTDE